MTASTTDWKPWFAWRPVFCRFGRHYGPVWLRWCDRRWRDDYGTHFGPEPDFRLSELRAKRLGVRWWYRFFRAGEGVDHSWVEALVKAIRASRGGKTFLYSRRKRAEVRAEQDAARLNKLFARVPVPDAVLEDASQLDGHLRSQGKRPLERQG